MQIDKDKLYISGKGNVSIEELADLIVAENDECTDNLLKIISSTMGAKDMKQHAQVVKKLHARCKRLSLLLEGKVFSRQAELELAFYELEHYATHALLKKVH